MVEGMLFEHDFPLAGAPGTFVRVKNTEIRFSADGIHWEMVDSTIPANDYRTTLNDVAIGPLGVIAVGAKGISGTGNSTIGFNGVVLLSRDGRTWERIADSGFADGEMQMAGSTRQGFVVFGRDFRDKGVIWTSADGREWLRATNQTGLQVAAGIRLLIQGDGMLTAIVGPPGVAVYETSPEFEVWRTEGRAEWQRVGRLAEGARGIGLIGASGGGRSIVVSPTRTWTSVDGVNWTVGVPPDGAIYDVAAYAGGYIAVGFSGSSPDDTCGGGNGPWVGHTWTSVDGRTWDERATFEGAAIGRLVPLRGSILGLGRAIEAGDVVTVAWTATLPGSLDGPLPTPIPTPSPTPRPSSAGCGG